MITSNLSQEIHPLFPSALLVDMKPQLRAATVSVKTPVAVKRAGHRCRLFADWLLFLSAANLLWRCYKLVSDRPSSFWLGVHFKDGTSTEGVFKSWQLRSDPITKKFTASIVILSRETDCEWATTCDVFQIARITQMQPPKGLVVEAMSEYYPR